MLIVVFSFFVQQCQSTPILTPTGIKKLQATPPYYCNLPLKFGRDTETRARFLEDCKSLDSFTKIPVPQYRLLGAGVHPQVCCPQYFDPDSICTPSDAWCPTYEEYEYPDDYYYGYEDEAVQDQVVSITIATQSCAAFAEIEYKGEFLTECVTIDKCPSLLESPTQPDIAFCGFDEEASLMMVCCTPSRETDSTSPKIKPRYPQANGEPRPVEDRTPEHCRRWKNNGACRLDKDFSGEEYDDLSVLSEEMFPFMMSACMKTCGWDDRDCVDEHINCPVWARLGYCITRNAGGFMAHTCRESCGVCGFLSPFNNETQEVGGLSYTNIKDSNFDCGRYKSYCEVQEDCTEEDLTQNVDGKPKNVTFGGWGYEYEETPGCSTTIINDRFALSAGHCYKNFGGKKDLEAGVREGRGITVRLKSDFEEVVEIKRAYTHPLYDSNQAYNDIIVLELGRRVPFDFDKYGHTPSCLDRGEQELAGKSAVVQGSGRTTTNKGDYRALLQTYVNIISNVECEETLRYNSTEASSNLTQSAFVKLTVESVLDYGINYGFVCAKGIQNEDGIFSGSCKGDSGGPLFVNFTDSNSVNRETLAGIVSGGVGCGLNVPGWYTKVSTYLPWVNCIIEASRDPINDQEMVEEKCNKVADCLVPNCINEEELFRTPDVPAEPEDSLFADYYTDDGIQDILDLRANEDKFKIPVCISDPKETVAECLLGLGISS